MRALTILLLVVAASLAVVVSGDEEKHREKRLFGGFIKMVNQFKDRISGAAKDVGKAAKSATRYGFKWTSDFSRNQFIDAKKSFKKIAPKVDFSKAVSALTTVLDSGFVNSLCRFSCASAASSVFQSTSPGTPTRSEKAVKMGCGPTCNAVNLTQQWLQRYGWEILPHPAHSPDLAPSDFHLFGPLKRYLGGMAFETEDDLISELRNWFDNLDVDFFRVGINSLLSRWQKCIDIHGDYVEK
ncbi:histone-lysine N-methyltransferase SETMAR [Plakobranchus ocellatus]|uniref:Histone-lysine N-methyltransferase SETMAR n=1 Tax=Plakobranchus ocellatus TaxID=259542 RepID=A0AAV3ZJN3_9GAST|nr:histone-lysine N-methyltransferase SETMAR [Plakobranchus ocellatus]